MQAINADIEALATEHCLDAEAFAAFLEYENLELDEGVEAFQDCYSGTFASLAEWAENFADDTGMLDQVPDHLRSYFDFSAWARDAELNGDVWTADLDNGDIAVFWRR